MESESQVSSSVLTLDETLPSNMSLAPIAYSHNLRGIMLLHLNLIQEQQQQILSQERELSSLHNEIAFLETKLRRINRRLSKRQTDSDKDVSNCPSNSAVANSTNSFEAKRRPRRSSHNSQAASTQLELRTLIPYQSHSITNSSRPKESNIFIRDTSNIDTRLEIPSFSPFSTSYLPQTSSTEDLSDSSFLKRHKKEEDCEKRRKRWDIQRVRELHKIIELQKKNAPYFCHGKKNPTLFLDSKASTLFSSNSLKVKEIEVADTVPIFAFGRPLPAIIPKPFELQIN